MPLAALGRLLARALELIQQTAQVLKLALLLFLLAFHQIQHAGDGLHVFQRFLERGDDPGHLLDGLLEWLAARC